MNNNATISNHNNDLKTYWNITWFKLFNHQSTYCLLVLWMSLLMVHLCPVYLSVLLLVHVLYTAKTQWNYMTLYSCSFLMSYYIPDLSLPVRIPNYLLLGNRLVKDPMIYWLLLNLLPWFLCSMLRFPDLNQNKNTNFYHSTFDWRLSQKFCIKSFSLKYFKTLPFLSLLKTWGNLSFSNVFWQDKLEPTT